MTNLFNMQYEVQRAIQESLVGDLYMFCLHHEASRYGVVQFEWMCLVGTYFFHQEGVHFGADLSKLNFEFHNYGTMDPILRDQMIEQAQAEFEIRYDL